MNKKQRSIISFFGSTNSTANDSTLSTEVDVKSTSKTDDSEKSYSVEKHLEALPNIVKNDFGSSPKKVKLMNLDCHAATQANSCLYEKATHSPPKLLPSMNSGEENNSSLMDLSAYDPSKESYVSLDDACWMKEQRVPYMAVAKTLHAIENISGRLRMIETLSNFFRSVILLTPNDLLYCLYLILNKLAPAYEGVELGIGDTVLIKALVLATGATTAKVKSELQKTGDLGDVAEIIKMKQRLLSKPAPLTVIEVFKRLTDIAAMTGQSSQTKKIEKIQSLIVSCRGCETRFLIRSLSGKLRIGLAEQSVLAALGQSFYLASKEGFVEQDRSSLSSNSEKVQRGIEYTTAKIKTAFCECPNYEKLLSCIFKYGTNELEKHCFVTSGVPLRPMLANPARSVQESFSRFGDETFSCEYKYDGERAQIHVIVDSGGRITVKLYSRNQEDNTQKYPDLVSLMPTVFSAKVAKSCILDCEAVAWDTTASQILPFQVLSTRKRKDVNASDIQVQVCLFAFDLLFFDGKSLIRNTLRERKCLLSEHFVEKTGKFMFATCLYSKSSEEIASFLKESIKGNCEGLIVKTLDKDATYDIAKRSHSWLKLKKDYLDSAGDTLDLVVIGAFFGTGKRAGRYGGFLLACYDPQNEEYQTICKVGTGFSDGDLQSLHESLNKLVIPKPKSYYLYDQSVLPDRWFEASQVWEVKAADLSISPAYKAALGLVDEEKGVSLRFPRFLRIRTDKDPESATSSEQVAEMYKNQDIIKNQENN